jgi:putative phosphoesterase
MAQRLGVVADAHANLPALEAALAELERRGCDLVVHAGDAVGIGPHPAEVVARLRAAGVLCVMGNHDEWATSGLPDPLPHGMGAGEAEHHRWVSAQLDDDARAAMARWPDELSLSVGPAAVTVLHYARTAAGPFDYIPEATPDDLVRVFAGVAGDAVVFGHDHVVADCKAGGRRFLNPGSLGFHDRAEARALVLSADASGGIAAEPVAVGYDEAGFLADFDRRRVPDAAFIRREFLRR